MNARDELTMGYAPERWVDGGRFAELLDAYRAEVLAEAVEAARSEYLTDNTGDEADEAYNRGVSDAVASVGKLAESGGA